MPFFLSILHFFLYCLQYSLSSLYLRNEHCGGNVSRVKRRGMNLGFSGLGCMLPESCSNASSAAKLRFNIYECIRRSCNRCVGLSFAYYSEKMHQVPTFGPVGLAPLLLLLGKRSKQGRRYLSETSREKNKF